MATCKKCGSGQVVKSGVVGGRQRYQCKGCGCHFREGDQRTDEKVVIRKALCILLYTMAKVSFRVMGRILGVDHAQAYRWIQEFGEPAGTGGSGKIWQMEFDEMWHFIGSKKENFEPSKLLTVIQGELWPGCPAVLILQPPNASTANPARWLYIKQRSL